MKTFAVLIAAAVALPAIVSTAVGFQASVAE